MVYQLFTASPQTCLEEVVLYVLEMVFHVFEAPEPMRRAEHHSLILCTTINQV